MIKIGKTQKLAILEKTKTGLKLEGGLEIEDSKGEVGDFLEVFVYNDGESIVATESKPLIELGGFETLRVSEINMVGAFCDMGIEKDLLIPYRNQAKDMIPNRDYVIHMYIDEMTNRLVGTAKLKNYLVSIAEDDIAFGQEVDLIVYGETKLGYVVIINQKYEGLIYESDVHEILRHGQKLKGYIKPIREDGKIDVSLTPLGHQSIEPNGQKILDMLKKEDGFLPFNDKSDPDAIRSKFRLSKKLFKKSVGGLYKKRLITMEKDGIRLADKN
ncbi:S1 RNA-binding domain-containing protein [Portibacter lacus]|uniref:GntR family transcriptional regulator n=1 Tax=Portibacter lacus TaxID=1099794 RepID=A0AA37SL01_9BACT|nr:GntR family transcriptional regulator [Portibacter lacus]GLR15820.1 GntR family transcriptional regulator [Portibacter lacus]